MRCTAGSVAALLISIAMWPETPRSGMPVHAVAEEFTTIAAQGAELRRLAARDEDEESDEEMEDREEFSAEDKWFRRVESKLKETTVEFNFVDMPLNEVMEYIADAMDVDILFDKVALEESSITLDEPINLVLSRTKLPAARVLEPLELTFRIRDGFVSVTTVEQSESELEIRVYPCRDLLQHSGTMVGQQSRGGRRRLIPGDDDDDDDDLTVARNVVRQRRRPSSEFVARRRPGNMPTATMSGFGGDPPRRTLAESLIEVVRQSTSGPWKADNSNADGTISSFDGLLVVRHNRKNHREVEHLLDMLREAHHDSDFDHEDDEEDEDEDEHGRDDDEDEDEDEDDNARELLEKLRDLLLGDWSRELKQLNEEAWGDVSDDVRQAFEELREEFERRRLGISDGHARDEAEERE